MEKNKLIIGKKYLHKHSEVVDGVRRETERYIKLRDVTKKGAIFRRDFEPYIPLTNKQISEELFDE